MVPNFCVKLKPDKFHTVAHFRKKVLLPFGKYSVYLKKEKKKSPHSFQLQRDSLYPLQKLLCAVSSRVETGFLMCMQLRDAESHFCGTSAPRNTVEPVRTSRHIHTKCSFFPMSPGTRVRGLKPSQASANRLFGRLFCTHVFIFLSFSELTTFFKLGGTPIFFSCKKEKKKKEIKSFSVIEIHDKLQTGFFPPFFLF